MPRRRRKDIKLVERKLGRESAWGQAWQGLGLVEIDPRQTERHYLACVVHEALHICYPNLDERKINTAGNKIGRLLWKLKYRRIRE